jgi:hypothetical protein
MQAKSGHGDFARLLSTRCATDPMGRLARWASQIATANKALVEFVAQWLNLPKTRVTLTAGQQSRFKRLLIEGLSESELRSRLPPAN